MIFIYIIYLPTPSVKKKNKQTNTKKTVKTHLQVQAPPTPTIFFVREKTSNDEWLLFLFGVGPLRAPPTYSSGEVVAP